MAVASIDIAKPCITFVPWPVVDDFAQFLQVYNLFSIILSYPN